MMRRSAPFTAIGIAALSLPLAIVACGDEEPAGPDVPDEPASVTLSAETVHLAAIGAAYPLHATVADANGIVLSGVAVDWSSDDESIATVDGSGRVEAVGVGDTEVTAAAGDASATATVTVTQSAASVAVEPALGELVAIGDSVRYSATVRDANGHAIEDAAVEWSAADEAVVTVDADGWATSQANGRTTVEAAVGEEVAGAAAVVVEQVVASVQVSPTADTIAQHGATQLAAEATDANGVAVPGATVAWSSSDPGLAPVDGGGGVSSAYWGVDATITATLDGVSGTAEVHVLDQIAFESLRDGNFEIYAMEADGSNLRNLTNETENDYEPVWSPDASQIVFHSVRDGTQDIYVMEANGLSPTRLTNDLASDENQVWSPDGTRIAFANRVDGDWEIYLMDADGSNPVRITDNTSNDLSPAWRPRP